MKINTGQVSVFILALMTTTLVWIAVGKEPKLIQKEIEQEIIKPDTLGQSRTDLTTYEFRNGATSTSRS